MYNYNLRSSPLSLLHTLTLLTGHLSLTNSNTILSIIYHLETISRDKYSPHNSHRHHFVLTLHLYDSHASPDLPGLSIPIRISIKCYGHVSSPFAAAYANLPRLLMLKIYTLLWRHRWDVELYMTASRSLTRSCTLLYVTWSFSANSKVSSLYVPVYYIHV